MPAIGMGMLWAGYTLLLWGYTKLQGYDIGISELVIPGRYKGSWPPPVIQDDAIHKELKPIPGRGGSTPPKSQDTGSNGSSGGGSMFV